MGLILDTSTLIAAERLGRSVHEIFSQLLEAHGETAVGISAVTLVELTHGVERAKLDNHRQRHQAFLDDLIADMPVYPLNVEVARLAGKISGQLAGKGLVVAFEDLVIGATALHLGFEVVTKNLRHFEMIPGLVVQEG